MPSHDAADPAEAGSADAVVVEGLVVRYGATVAVAGLDFTAPVGQVTALVGPNGAGKTSTVEACVGLRRPAAGVVRLLGLDIRDPSASATLRARVGTMLQDGGLYTTARPGPLLRYLASLYPDPADPDALLAVMGVDPGSRTAVRRLSGGEQRRVAAAAALVGRPTLAFLDEPTAGLDPAARRAFHDVVRGLVGSGTTIVLTTHLMDDVERLADRVVVIARGRAVASGTVADLVGAAREISFLGTDDVDLPALRRELPPEASVRREPSGRIHVTGSADPRILAAVAQWCAAHGVPTTDLRAGSRSLEDVIVDLTGDA